MKEILKQLPNGDWAHDHWEDENGNIIPEPYNTPQEYFELKQKELLSSCYADIYGKFTIWGKWFACDQTARDDINDLYYAYQKPDFVGRYWFTFGGTEVVYITPEMVIPFKDAVVEHKDLCWNKYAVLSNKLGAIDLNSPDAIELIRSIQW